MASLGKKKLALKENNNHSLRAKLSREEFKEYFNNEGVVSWQWRMCGLH